jgi:hypothetical protein
MKVQTQAQPQPQKGAVVMAASLRKTSERFDKDGNLLESTDSQSNRFEQIKAARAKKLGIS